LTKRIVVHLVGAWFHAFFYIAANAYDPFVHEKAIQKNQGEIPWSLSLAKRQ